jgi:hypothetical protein
MTTEAVLHAFCVRPTVMPVEMRASLGNEDTALRYVFSQLLSVPLRFGNDRPGFICKVSVLVLGIGGLPRQFLTNSLTKATPSEVAGPSGAFGQHAHSLVEGFGSIDERVERL